jgi:hypothetical protein
MLQLRCLVTQPRCETVIADVQSRSVNRCIATVQALVTGVENALAAAADQWHSRVPRHHLTVNTDDDYCGTKVQAPLSDYRRCSIKPF